MERWWRINQVLVQKLQDTGYQVEELLPAVASVSAFRAAYPDAVTNPPSLNRVVQPLPGTMAELRAPNGLLLAFTADLADKKSTITEQVREVVEQMQGQGVTTCFMVIAKPLYSKAAELVRSIAAVQRIVPFFQKQLAFNVTRHRRVPRHELLTPAEASKWLNTTLLKRSQLPRIFEDDPLARYYDAQPTDLMRVTNPSPTVGEFTRTVVVVRRLVR